MKLISARASRAPAPTSTVNLAPAILVPRSKSITPSAGPRSQCACGVNENSRGVPERRTSTLSAALFPTGTDACGTLGMASSPRLRRCSIVSSSTLELLDLLRALPVGLLDLRRIQPLSLRARHLVARRVLLALQALELRQQSPASRLEGCQVFQLGGQVNATVLQSCANGLEIVPEKGGIEHRWDLDPNITHT